MKAAPLAGWLLADLAIILAIIGLADLSGTGSGTTSTVVVESTTTSSTSTSTSTSTTTSTTAVAGIQPPVEFMMTDVRNRLSRGDVEGVVAEIDGQLRKLNAIGSKAAIVLVFSKDGASSTDSQRLSEDVIALLNGRFASVMKGAQLRPYIRAGNQGDVKIELFLYPNP